MRLIAQHKSLYYFIHGVNAVLACASQLMAPEKSYLALIFTFSVMTFLLSIFEKRYNLLFMMRTFFLGIVGYIAMGTMLLNENLLFGYHMHESQTLEIASVMYVCTALALLGNEIGLGLAGKQIPISHHAIPGVSPHRWLMLGLLAFIVAAVSGQLIANHMGPTILVSGYGVDPNESSLLLNNLNSVVNVSIYLLFLAWLVTRSRILLGALVFAFFYTLIYCQFLRGIRMDVLNAILGCYVIYTLALRKSPHIKIKHLTVLSIAFIFIQAMGALRSVMYTGLFSFEDLLTALSYLTSIEDAAGIAFNQGTINDIATTFSGIIFLLRNHIVDWANGQSYLDFIARTPPQFMLPNRPPDLSAIFVNLGYSSGGGFFEVAEAYFNFAYLGCLFVPAVISYIIARAYYKVKSVGTLWNYFVLFGIMSVWMRGLLYQTFAFWKAFVTAALLYFIFNLVSSLLTSASTKKENKQCVEFLG
ncbi:hypothetical protein D3C72_128850 [compost metagenome]